MEKGDTSGVQFDKVLVREDVFATDTLSIVNSVSPDPGKLERGSQFSVYPQRQVLNRRVSWNREGRFKIGCFIVIDFCWLRGRVILIKDVVPVPIGCISKPWVVRTKGYLRGRWCKPSDAQLQKYCVGVLPQSID